MDSGQLESLTSRSDISPAWPCSVAICHGSISAVCARCRNTFLSESDDPFGPRADDGDCWRQTVLRNIAVVDPSFFQVIRLLLVEGDPAMFSPSLSRSSCLRESLEYFGDIDPLGENCEGTGSGILCDRNDAPCLTAAHPLTVTAYCGIYPQHPTRRLNLVMPNSSLSR